MARTTIRTEDITASAVTSAKIAAGAVDTSGIRNDIATLALHSAIADNKAAFNLTNDFIDQFEDSTGIDTTTDTERNTDEWVGSISGYGGLDSSTKLLVHMDGADDGTVFLDSSTTARTGEITVGGNTHTDTTIKKIGTASAQFDGTEDFLSWPSEWGNYFVGSAGGDDWTLECWLYWDGTQDAVLWEQGNSAERAIQLYIQADGDIQMYLASSDGSWDLTTVSGSTMSSNTWTHVALVKSGSAIRLFKDGVLDGTIDGSITQATINNSDYVFHFGIYRASGGAYSSGFKGYADELRISSVARYSSTFTDFGQGGGTISSPTAFTADADTKLLLHCDGADGGTTFTDSVTGHPALRSGAVTKTGTKKFGTASAYFTGHNNAQYVSFPDSDDWNFGTGDFTWDCWINMPDITHVSDYDLTGVMGPSIDGTAYTVIYWVPAAHSTAGARGLNFYSKGPGNTDILEFAQGSTTGWSNDTWYHIAITRNGTAWKLWRDGAVIATHTGSVTIPDWAASFVLGALGKPSSILREWKGYMDEVRISKGVDRTSDSTDPMYIVSGSTFTPPTQAYDALSVNATGNFTSTNQTASASVSKMGIVVLYKDLYGTATLNTDITAELSANGGSNYATATLLDRGTFSTGIKMVVANDVAVTAGTSCKYRISFANQADDSKETQVHGVALLY